MCEEIKQAEGRFWEGKPSLLKMPTSFLVFFRIVTMGSNLVPVKGKVKI